MPAAAKLAASTEVNRKTRMKRRLMRTLTSSFRRKSDSSSSNNSNRNNNSSTDFSEAATESEDSDTEGRHADFKNRVFVAKRTIDQSLEGKALREALTASPRLLPPAAAEIEPEDYFENFGRLLKRQDSNSTINSNRTHDSLASKLETGSISSQAAVSSGLKKNNVVIEELSLITTSADDRVHTFTDEGSSTVHKAKSHGKNLKVRFADENGGELELHHWTVTMYSEEENDWARAIVLLLSPKKKKFEFLHVSYNLYEKTSVMDVLNQLPEIATDDALKEQKYVGLLRKDGGRELINTVSIQSYYLKKNEILVAVVDGHYGKAMIRMATPLLDNRKIMKAVTRVRAKKVNIRQLKPLTKKKSSSDKVRVYPLDEIDHHHADESRTRFGHAEPEDDLNSSARFEESVPDMDRVFHDDHNSDYLEDDTNKDKVTLTRFVNAGILTAVVYGVQRKFRGKKQQRQRR